MSQDPNSNMFDQTMTWTIISSLIRQKKITQYRVQSGLTDPIIQGNMVIVPPHMEYTVSKLLKESKNEQ